MAWAGNGGPGPLLDPGPYWKNLLQLAKLVQPQWLRWDKLGDSLFEHLSSLPAEPLVPIPRAKPATSTKRARTTIPGAPSKRARTTTATPRQASSITSSPMPHPPQPALATSRAIDMSQPPYLSPHSFSTPMRTSPFQSPYFQQPPSPFVQYPVQQHYSSPTYSSPSQPTGVPSHFLSPAFNHYSASQPSSSSHLCHSIYPSQTHQTPQTIPPRPSHRSFDMSSSSQPSPSQHHSPRNFSLPLHPPLNSDDDI